MDAGTGDASEIGTPECSVDQAARHTHRTVIGLGNEMLTDDGVGIRVVRELRTRVSENAATFEELSIGGLQLLDYLSEYEECIVVDAVATGRHPAGTILRCVQEDPESTVPMRSSHQIDLMQVVRLAALLGAEIPRRIVVYGIEAGDVRTFHEGCTSAVERAIPHLVDVICRDMRKTGPASSDVPGTWQIIHHTFPD